jgi:hypothetical protein
MIQDYLKAGYPALVLLTQEPDRAEKLISANSNWKVTAWDCLRGIRQADGNTVIDELIDPVEAVNWLSRFNDTVLIAHNLHVFFDVPEIMQAIQNGLHKWKATGCCLVVVSPAVQLRPELEKAFHVLDLALPSEDELKIMQEDLARGVHIEDEEGNDIAVSADELSCKAAKGLTEFEAETAFALSLVKQGKFSPKVITEVKGQMIRKSGLMEFWQPADIGDVGGLDSLKAYIWNRAKAFKPGNEHLPKPKGIILVGLPGTGKSLTCKATASILGWPLIRLDIGRLKGSLVGESERRMRQATAIIDAFGEAVIWADEIEKAFAGSKASGETDGGTTASMLGHLLTWLSETSAPILFAATANNISQLPPEFLRAGRFDSIFFVDLPTLKERHEIIGIMNRRYNTSIPEEYAERLQGFTGSEIEQIAKDSLFDGLDAAMSSVIPLSKTMREEVNALRDWARNRARFANAPEDETGMQRKVHLARA